VVPRRIRWVGHVAMIAEIINKQLMSNIFERCLLGEPGKRGESLKFILEKQVMSM